jgi:hypothetical protein
VSSTRVLKRLDRVVTREIAGETLLVPISNDITDMHHIFALNPVASHIWNALDGTTPVSRLVDSICDSFDVDRERAEQDLAEFLDELLESGLVREA